MPGFNEMPKIEKKKKYTAGFLKEWAGDSELKKKAMEMAGFYIKTFSELNMDIPENELALIHFTDNESLKLITQEKKIKNSSQFFDCDQSWLKEHGCDVAQIKNKFGSPMSVVAIPLESFKKWANTLSWIKGVKHDAFENAIVFTLPKDGLILRNHAFTENSFKEDLKSNNQGSEEMFKNMVKTYESTEKFNDQAINEEDFMPEVWIPTEINLDKFKVINYPKQSK